ncbi:MAG: Sec-independent protein translocase protein TatB [Candidatus Contendobacter sp.]
MFEIGFGELVVIAVVALLVVGPERLPGLARTVGLWLGKGRRMIAQVKAEVDRELQLEDIRQTLRQQVNLGEVNDLSDRMKSLRAEIEAEFDDPGRVPSGWTDSSTAASPLSDAAAAPTTGSVSTAATPTAPAVGWSGASPAPVSPPPVAPAPLPQFSPPPPSDRNV